MTGTTSSPWFSIADAAAYLKRGKRFVRNEVRAGRLRAAIVGGRRELITCSAWCDDWVIEQTKVTPLTIARRQGG